MSTLSYHFRAEWPKPFGLPVIALQTFTDPTSFRQYPESGLAEVQGHRTTDPIPP